MKNMRTLQKRIAYQLQQGSPDAEVTGITCDSRKVQPQNVFVCIRGNRMDGHVYAEEAVERGAAVLVAERELEGIPFGNISDCKFSVSKFTAYGM